MPTSTASTDPRPAHDRLPTANSPANAHWLQIPPTSNQAERDLRPAKTQQKISGRLRSEKAARDRYAIRGYASTAAKHGASALAALRDALAGNAWMPPLPEIA